MEAIREQLEIPGVLAELVASVSGAFDSPDSNDQNLLRWQRDNGAITRSEFAALEETRVRESESWVGGSIHWRIHVVIPGQDGRFSPASCSMSPL